MAQHTVELSNGRMTDEQRRVVALEAASRVYSGTRYNPDYVIDVAIRFADWLKRGYIP